MGNSPSKSGEDPSDQKQCIQKVNYLVFFFPKDIDSSIHCFFSKNLTKHINITSIKQSQIL